MRTQVRAARGAETLDLAARYSRARGMTLEFCRPLAVEDHVVQSMPDASPTKWHLAHTTWFFEEFVVRAADPGAGVSTDAWRRLFNSYYRSVGEVHPRSARGLLSRPTLEEVLEYRVRVDERVQALLESGEVPETLLPVVELGFAHEEQHQELILTDILHAFASNPLRPTYRSGSTPLVEARPQTVPPAVPPAVTPAVTPTVTPAVTPTVTPTFPPAFVDVAGGLTRVGHDRAGAGFAFDNEGPRHEVLLQPHAIADRPISNGEYRAFVQDGGYRDSALWLSDGWAVVESERWTRPMYWSEDLASQFSLQGEVALDEAEPVRHVSYYEADAFARWAGARLPTEFEWEHMASRGSKSALRIGEVWEWTQSPYSPYPGFHTANRGLGEYNGKFMINQLVLRGGSALTPPGHARTTYRNFFSPSARWQASGLRLAQDR